MSKALLVIDLNDDEKIRNLKIDYKVSNLDDEVIYADKNVQLRELPQEHVIPDRLSSCDDYYTQGFNDCLKEISEEANAN